VGRADRRILSSITHAIEIFSAIRPDFALVPIQNSKKLYFPGASREKGMMPPREKLKETSMTTRRSIRSWLAIPIFALALPAAAFAEQGDDNPTGVAGAFNGSITTAGSYDPYIANMHRQIDDIVVPGSVGAYPLKWTRYWNSHTSWHDNNSIGASWRFSYMNYQHGTAYPPNFPDGRQIQKDDFGVEEWTEKVLDPTTFNVTGEIIHLADGGKVVLQNYANGTTQGVMRPV
jgi:hypothetical protein